MSAACVAAPAKLNFGLRIVGRRPNGYHELESLFVPLDLVDDVALEVEPAAAATVQLTLEAGPSDVPADASNLAHRAARAFLGASGLSLAVHVRLTKRIPAAAGLGGGSSDAGAVLRGLAGLFPDALSGEALAKLALELGADVPFFLDPRPSWVRGIGERVDPQPRVPGFQVVLVNPGVPLGTAEVYAAYAALGLPLTASGADSTLRPLSGEGPASQLQPWLENDLEAAAIRLCPPVARLRDALRAAGAQAVSVSGSGPTVFGVFDGASEARAALTGLERHPGVAWARCAATVQSP